MEIKTKTRNFTTFTTEDNNLLLSNFVDKFSLFHKTNFHDIREFLFKFLYAGKPELRICSISEGARYVRHGGEDYEVLIGILIYRGLTTEELKERMILELPKRIGYSKENLHAYNASRKELHEAVDFCMYLSFGANVQEYAEYLAHTYGEKRYCNLIKLPSFIIDRRRNVWHLS